MQAPKEKEKLKSIEVKVPESDWKLIERLANCYADGDLAEWIRRTATGELFRR